MPKRNRYWCSGSLATMKSINSATPASLAPGVASLGMMISVRRATIAYSDDEKNCGRYSAGLICKAALPTWPHANPHLLKPGKVAAAAAVPKTCKIFRRWIPCPAIALDPLGKVLDRCCHQIRRRLVWITRRIVLDRAISLVTVLLQRSEGLLQIDM